MTDEDAPALLERRDTAKLVLVEVPDIAAARDCYRNAACRTAIAHARRAAKRDLLILDLA